MSQHHPSWLVLQLQQVAKVLGYNTQHHTTSYTGRITRV